MTASASGQVRPFRFGIQVSGTPGPRELSEIARRAEDLGFSSLLLPDHLGTGPAPLSALGYLAGVTRDLRLGTLVLCNDVRHPLVVAEEALMLDLLSDGRLELGLGAGWREEEHRAAGLPFLPAAVRVARLLEAVEVIDAAWSTEPVHRAGPHYVVQGWTSELPRRRPTAPLMLPGSGRRVRETVARRGGVVDIAAAFPAAAATTARVEHLREVSPAAGTANGSLEIASFVMRVADPGDRHAEHLARWLRMTLPELLDSPAVLVGTAQERLETLHRRREEWGVSYVMTPADDLERTAPLVARLAGH